MQTKLAKILNPYLKIISVPILLCQMMLLTSCATKELVPIKQQIPANLTQPSVVRLLSNDATFGDLVIYSSDLLTIIQKQNEDKLSIREINKD